MIVGGFSIKNFIEDGSKDSGSSLKNQAPSTKKFNVGLLALFYVLWEKANDSQRKVFYYLYLGGDRHRWAVVQPSQERIAKACGIDSLTTVKGAIAYWEESGLLNVVRAEKLSFICNIYELADVLYHDTVRQFFHDLFLLAKKSPGFIKRIPSYIKSYKENFGNWLQLNRQSVEELLRAKTSNANTDISLEGGGSPTEESQTTKSGAWYKAIRASVRENYVNRLQEAMGYPLERDNIEAKRAYYEAEAAIDYEELVRFEKEWEGIIVESP